MVSPIPEAFRVRTLDPKDKPKTGGESTPSTESKALDWDAIVTPMVELCSMPQVTLRYQDYFMGVIQSHEHTSYSNMKR